MNFSNNLIQLRKNEKMSQEALADKIGVTRQTIYKWETSATYPEMDKLIDLAKIFNVSVDYLINGDIEEPEEESLSKEEIIKKVKNFGLVLGIAIAFILIGVAVMVALCEKMETLGICLGIGIIFASAITIILVSMRFDTYSKLNKLSIVSTKKEKVLAHNSLTIKIVVGVSLILIGVMQLIAVGLLIDGKNLVDEDFYMSLSTSCLLVLIGISVILFVEGGNTFSLYEDQDERLSKGKDDSLCGKICGAVMILATAIYLLIGFVWDSWRIGWISFAIGGLICGIVSIFLSKKDDKEK